MQAIVTHELIEPEMCDMTAATSPAMTSPTMPVGSSFWTKVGKAQIALGQIRKEPRGKQAGHDVDQRHHERQVHREHHAHPRVPFVLRGQAPAAR